MKSCGWCLQSESLIKFGVCGGPVAGGDVEASRREDDADRDPVTAVGG